MSVSCPRRRARVSLGTALALGVLAHDAVAQNYSVKINPTLNGLDIKIEPVSNAGILVVDLTNNSGQKVRCDLVFEADPQLPFRTFVFVDPGKQESAVFRATQQWFEVDVDVKCEAAKK